ncbi:ATP-dependent RNA helicase HrpA [Thiolapillus brandeum]|uniref:RNA helicase n=1 Tax=Thiolapillus brandeum TaxID=1076588 RepID=A0A7U6JHC4_9GAMM|nr:ATP-dependent RNA helicase HrpA [Thiolapillus brandeum]BAO44334.1 ATP-dependent helicase HrpA [Thiolapillus brandeum]
MPDSLKQHLGECLIRDRHRLRTRLNNLSRLQSQGQNVDAALAEVAARIENSRRRALVRRQTLPVPEYPPELPISARRDEIRQLIRKHQVIVLCGETGSGKSTQLPKICLELGRGVFGRIAHTQPRRIAARSLASRISSELGRELGEAVGYKVRFHDRVSDSTHIKLLTDGMLLAEIQQDRWLKEYDTIILDEAHERSLNIDFLLGYLKQLLQKRRDLKLIVTSATIDPQKFSRHFNDAPVIEVSGRTYPVELRYRPPGEEEEGGGERGDAVQQAIRDAVDELSREDRGDILVFLSGEREIRETAEGLRKHRLQVTEILPLYARLSPAEQARIFRPSGQRRIVLATNVAETSLTVPGIRHVIDTGYARISRYSHRSKIQRLPVERISQASANQRKGRCGRVAEGICIRLYTEEDYESRPEFMEPEIQRTNLASVILQMKMLGFGDIEKFPFIDPPDNRQIKDGYRVLEEIGAVDGLGRITRLGRKLARLPVDPRIARMLLEAAHTHALREVLVIASALSVQDPRDRPHDKREQADEAHALFAHEASDFLAYVALWNFIREKRRHLTQRKFRRLCREYFLSYTRIMEWQDIHKQLRTQMHEMGYRDNQEDPGYETIHKALLSGLLSHIGFRQTGKGEGYLGARNSRFHLFPGSSQFSTRPKWVVAAELVETSKLYARGCARIQPDWVESLAGHLIKHSYSEPHWQGKRGQVGAYEKVTLFGLVLVPRRRVNFGPVDPKQSREIFIRFGLVEGDLKTRAPFWRHNRELVDYVRDMEARTRRPDLLVDEERMVAFYDQRIPQGIYSTPQLEKWLRKASSSQPRILHMELEDVLARETDAKAEAQFPKTLELHGMSLPLEYRFEPGHPADGVTLVVPAGVLRQVSPGRLDWLVPGLLEEKLVALLKSLPKSLRKSFVPVPDYAARALVRLQASDTPLVQALATVLKELSGGVHIPEDAWKTDALPDYLRMRVRVVDASGKTLAADRNLLKLQQQYADVAETAPRQQAAHPLERQGIKSWDFGELPEQVESEHQGIRLTLWPALHDDGDSVAIRLSGSQAEALQHHRAGLRRLFMLALPREIRELKKQLPGLQKMRLQYAKAPKAPPHLRSSPHQDLEQELVALVLDRSFLPQGADIRNAEAFAGRLEANLREMPEHAREVSRLASGILEHYQKLRKSLAGIHKINWLASTQDMQWQLERLVFQGFLQMTPWEQLQQYPRYLKALSSRLQKLQNAPLRDQQLLNELQPLQDDWLERWKAASEKGVEDPRLEEIRWMLEEFRISLFAQELKTAYPVSAKRIKKRWRELGL